MAMLRFAIVMLLALVCRNGVAQEEFPFNALVFQGASAYRPGESVEYFLVKHGFLRGAGPDEEAAMIGAGNPTGIPSRRLIPAPRYEDFIKKLVAAETAAQAEMIGIWSDQFKPVRDKMGLTPLATLKFPE